MFRFSALLACLLTVSSGLPAQAQGLLWNLPEDGTQIKVEGTYEQTIFRPQSTQGNLELSWLRHMTIRSVGKKDGEYKGEMQPCRWIEIKVQTGSQSADGVATGSVGERIYRVLVPESAIRGSVNDPEGLPVSYIPIVEGYRKTNDRDLTPKPINSKVLQVYPIISLIRHYKTMTESDIEQTVQIGTMDVVARKLTGQLVQESSTRRFTHKTTLLRSDQVPFGLAQWEVQINEERKADVQTRDEFEPVSEVKVKMSVRQIEKDAKAELIIEATN